jgi:S-adenosyl-L-methionine hydrolase (adenosine-forming)
MGLRDYYVAAVKGAILSQVEDVQIIDISHEIKPFNIVQAAFVVRNCWSSFPKGTVHVIGVNPDLNENTKHVIVVNDGHYFIGADNGFFSLIFDKIPDDVFELNITQDNDEITFPTKNLFVKAACHIARGGTPEVVGRRVKSVRQAQDFRPVIEEHVIKGTVVYIDNYGNVITNISNSLFKEVGRGRDFAIMFKRASLDIRKIREHYNQVPEGERLALFSSSGFLQIAINKGAPGNGGGANTLFGLKLNDIIRIEFNANQSR